MSWTQVYDPLGNLLGSAAIAALPVVVLLGLLALFHVRAHLAALAGLAAALAIAIAIYGMPAPLALAAAVSGAAFGLFPIGWIVVSAIFFYEITVQTGQFAALKESIASFAEDRRLQAVLIAFSFGAFLEGAAGFGTPVAISASMLIGLGFRPLQAAGLALLGNTAPVAFGALGTPIVALARVTGLPIEQLSAMVGRQLPPFSVAIPFCLVWAMAGWRGMLEVWPACFVSGATFALVQFVVSNYHGPWLVDIVGALLSIAGTVALLRVWRPRSTWRFPHEQDRGGGVATASGEGAAVAATPPRRAVLMAWLPWGVLSMLVFLWGLPGVKSSLNEIAWVEIPVPHLDRSVWRVPPVVAEPKAEEASFVLNPLSATGSALFLAGLLTAPLLGVGTTCLARMFCHTLWRVRFSLLTIAAMLALGFTARYGGLDATMGLAFANTGVLFPFFSPLLGWLGVALTGSDTSSNVLFGNLQQITAQQLGLPPILAAAANSSGGVMGKMIDAQSIVVASVATRQDGQEGAILRYVFFPSVALAALVGLLVLAQAYLFPRVVP